MPQAKSRSGGAPQRPGLAPPLPSAGRTVSSGSFHAGAPIPTLAGLRRASTYRYQTFPTQPPLPPPAERPDDGSCSDSACSSSSPPPSSPSSTPSSTPSSSTSEQTPLPVRQLLLLAFLSLSEQTALNSISPYLPRMVASMPGVPAGQSGLYVGILASAFALAQLSTNFLWGYASDVVGRKPVLLAGTSALTCCFCVFGLCRLYWQAVVVHVAMGLLNGNAACVPTVLGEVTDRSNQSKAFTYLPVIYSLGGITGPALGGLLVGRLGPDYPYLGPNVLAAAMLATSVAAVALWFDETLDDQSGPGPWKPRWIARLSAWLRRRGNPRAHRNSWSSRWPYRQAAGNNNDGNDNNQQQQQRRPLLAPEAASVADDDYDDYDDDDDEDTDDSHSPSDAHGHAASAASKAGPDEERPPVWRDLLNGTTITLLTTYLVFQLSNISFNSLYPIFASAPAPTGRELSPGRIGVSLSLAGLATIIFQAFLYQPLKARTGSLGAYRLSLLGIAVSMALIPWVGYLDDDPPLGLGTGRLWLYLELGIVLVLKNICAVSGLSSVMLLITNSAPSHASLGTLNGVAQTLSALGRSFGPFVSGGLFTLSINVRPKGEALAWSVFGGLALLGWLGSMFIRGNGLESEDWDDDGDGDYREHDSV
ncbi:hypothetical protein CDD83_276 [Cordyceps sp. RAO-2017]|nr:hypothetical protein CDD83_276 [Cordyceps sp. RAO-2017]